MSNKLIKVQNLTKVFRIGSIFSRTKLTAVDKVSFDIDNAEIYTLAGESGSGKTTVSRIILGFIEASEGEIQYKGKDITKIKSGKEKREFIKDVQAIFQNPFETFNPLRKVENYLYETAKNFGVAKGKKDDDVIKEALNAVGLELNDVKGKYPGEFSGGQLQRISIARALITRPALLIADEPVSMVDASLRMSIVNLFKELKEKYGVSILYITHDLATAYYVSDKIAIMLRGNIVEKGTVEKVLLEPKHPYTLMLRDSIPQP
ncbi:MAG: ABC transporter ATP-binding protein, partial [Thermoanaerobacterium sp.]|nr:ABC transporter ATP-binding protein [Thermoanaerobacterium sp.]